MKHSRIGPAPKGEAGELFTPANTPADNRISTQRQARTIPPMPPAGSNLSLSGWKESLVVGGYFKRVEIVSGDIGPIAAIGSPLVCVGFGESWSCVWIDPARLPWGWSDPYCLFLGDKRVGAVKYALELAKRVRNAAEAEQLRRDRIIAARAGGEL